MPCLQVRPCEQSAADTLAPVAGEHRNPQLCIPVGACEVRCACEAQLVIGYAEDRIALEIDAGEVAPHGAIGDRDPEPQAPIVAAQRKKVSFEPGAVEPRQLANRNQRNASLAAASVASISAAPCAAETKPASYAEGAR